MVWLSHYFVTTWFIVTWRFNDYVISVIRRRVVRSAFEGFAQRSESDLQVNKLHVTLSCVIWRISTCLNSNTWFEQNHVVDFDNTWFTHFRCEKCGGKEYLSLTDIESHIITRHTIREENVQVWIDQTLYKGQQILCKFHQIWSQNHYVSAVFSAKSVLTSLRRRKSWNITPSENIWSTNTLAHRWGTISICPCQQSLTICFNQSMF